MKAGTCDRFMACVAFLMTFQSRGKTSEQLVEPLRGISDKKDMQSGYEYDTEDQSCRPGGNNSKPCIDSSSFTQQSMESSQETSNSFHHEGAFCSGRPLHGKSILPPVLMKCHANPTLAQHDDDGWRIRSRYLHCLGMDEQFQHHDHPKSFCLTRSTQLPKPACSHDGWDSALTPLHQSPMKIEPLKDDHGKHDDTILDRLKSRNDNCDTWDIEPFHTKAKKCAAPLVEKDNSNYEESTCNVSFYPIVQVREIPSHHSYSERIKKTIWMLPSEYAESVTKNVIEFMSEGYEPETVLDETDFVERDGELVHPVCLMLDEPDNVRLKQIYYGFKAKASTKGD